ncbi:hypothetical protein FHS39_002475 [Streptomyces olivoverticillatus]|uniref:Secreted protein n=1 Tax=Streptomyces olivoverticillatus TaxID=66427 RepID=A0A7W7LNN2_9ACTN|nr:hypothetical protein [Streptomyces olivoverticillatus]MBB4893444.1 hypothetical protein [Streptomyces olivoverticillatus]
MASRRGTALALSSLVLVGTSWLTAPPGQADEGKHREGIVCEGASESTYDPPLTLLPHETRVHTKAGYVCTFASGRKSEPAMGFLEGVSPAASCDGLSNPRITEFVKYADGERSLIAYDSGSTLRVAGILDVMLSGRVVKGRGEGQSVRRDVLLALPRQQLPTDCLLSGIQGHSGQARLEIKEAKR